MLNKLFQLFLSIFSKDEPEINSIWEVDVPFCALIDYGKMYLNRKTKLVVIRTDSSCYFNCATVCVYGTNVYAEVPLEFWRCKYLIKSHL